MSYDPKLVAVSRLQLFCGQIGDVTYSRYFVDKMYDILEYHCTD